MFSFPSHDRTVYLVDKVAEIYGSYKSTPKMNWEDFLKKYSIKEYNVTYGETRTFNPTKDGANEKIGEDAIFNVFSNLTSSVVSL